MLLLLGVLSLDLTIQYLGKAARFLTVISLLQLMVFIKSEYLGQQ